MLTATRLVNGRVQLRAYLGEGDWYERDYPDADAAGGAPFIDRYGDEDSRGRSVSRIWLGEDDWQPGDWSED